MVGSVNAGRLAEVWFLPEDQATFDAFFPTRPHLWFRSWLPQAELRMCATDEVDLRGEVSRTSS